MAYSTIRPRDPSYNSQSGNQDSFYSSAEWLAVRRRVLKRDGYCCVRCGASVQGKGLARVDHIVGFKVDRRLALVLSNLRTLCVPCDNAVGGRTKRNSIHGGCGPDGYPTDPQHPWNK